MKIAITNPTTWPRVRRGAERFLNELAGYLAQRGHQVTVISSKPGEREIIRQRGYTTICHRRYWHPILGRLGILEFHVFATTVLAKLLRGHYDIVLCLTFMDTFAANLARRITGVPTVFWVNGLPPPIRYVRSLSLGGRVFRKAVQDADEVILLSSYMREYFARRFGRQGQCIPVPVDTGRFRLSFERDHDRPTILCAAALDDARKGGRVLMRAFDRLKTIRPKAVLQISSDVTERTQADLIQLISPEWRGHVHFLGSGRLEDLPRLFGRAAISVLPSLWEPFGMVVLESLATGTPVVGTRDGAIPELISDPAIGRLFDPGESSTPEPSNVDGLLRAMLECFEMSRQPETALRCRAHAERYGWEEVAPLFEDVLTRLQARGKSLVVARGADA